MRLPPSSASSTPPLSSGGTSSSLNPSFTISLPPQLLSSLVQIPTVAVTGGGDGGGGGGGGGRFGLPVGEPREEEMQRRWGQTWAGVDKTAQAAAAHAVLFCFTLLPALRVDGRTTYSWWIIFIPLWLFHGIVARRRFSMPAPSLPHGRYWAPCHSIVAAPLLIAFELLLCIYLESLRVRNHPSVNLKIVFLPLLAFEAIILINNFSLIVARKNQGARC